MPNGTLYGGIWKFHDFLIFPRFRLIGETFVSLEQKSGYSYLRKIDPKKLSDSDSMAVSHLSRILSEHYLWEEKEINEKR